MKACILVDKYIIMKDLFQDKLEDNIFPYENGKPVPDHILELKMQDAIEHDNYKEALAIQKELEKRKRSL